MGSKLLQLFQVLQIVMWKTTGIGNQKESRHFGGVPEERHTHIALILKTMFETARIFKRQGYMGVI